MDDVSNKDLLLWGAIAVGAYLLYRAVNRVLQVPGAAVSALEQGIANLWVTLTAAPRMNVPGSVQFPDGTQVPIATLPIKTDAQGSVYTNTGGRTFQLQPWVSDASGNPVWPAVPVGT